MHAHTLTQHIYIYIICCIVGCSRVLINTYKYPKSGYNSSYPTWSQLSNVEPVIQHGASYTKWSQFLELACTFMNQLSNVELLIQRGVSYTTWGQLYNLESLDLVSPSYTTWNPGLINTYGTYGIYK